VREEQQRRYTAQSKAALVVPVMRVWIETSLR